MFKHLKKLYYKSQLNNIIHAWSLDYPSSKHGTLLLNGAVVVQGWILFKSTALQQQAELIITINDHLERHIPLNCARPDVIEKILGSNSADHPQLHCGFRFTLPIYNCQLPITLRVGNSTFELGKIDLPAATSSPTLKVLSGHEQWLFLDNDTNFSVDQHQGALALTPLALANWQTYQTSLISWSSSLTAPALLLAAPAKEAVLPHYHSLPAAKVSSLAPLLNLFSTENLLYPVAELKRMGDAAYYRTDTHWTHQAAAKVAALVGLRMGLDNLAITKLLEQDRYAERMHIGDLGNKFEPPRQASAMMLTSFSFRSCVVYDNGLPNFGHLMVMQNMQALNPGSLLVFGSSSSDSMFSTLCRLFGIVVFVHSAGSLDDELIQTLNPDFLVAQTTSRFMIRPPAINFNTKAAIVSKQQNLDSNALSVQKKAQVIADLQKITELNLLPWHEVLMNKPGWYLINALLPAYCAKLRVELHFTTAKYKHCISLPASLKGRVFEVIRLTEPTQSLQIVAYENGQSITPSKVEITNITWFTAVYWMLHRTWPVLRSIEPELGQRLGLSLSSLLWRLPTSYALASSLRAHAPEPDYTQWQFRYWRLYGVHKRRMKKRLRQPDVAPLSCTVIDPASESSKIKLANLNLRAHQHLIILQPSHTKLQPWAKAWFLVAMAEQPHMQLFYSDHDAIDSDSGSNSGSGSDIDSNSAENRHSPCFKPSWSPELQQCSHYVGCVVAIRESALATIIQQLGHLPSSYLLALEAGLLFNNAVQHIPAVLWHQLGDAGCANADELTAHLTRHGIDAKVLIDQRGHLRVKRTLPALQPKVSVIIPTRNMLQVLKPCVDSLLSTTRWSNLEVLIIDNQSNEAATLNYLKLIQQDERVKVLLYDQPFNYSAINNFAVSQASGELICLLNNDTEVIHADWLEEMVSRLLQPGVGAVGARLYFSDGRVQHAGDVVGVGGCAQHLHGILEADDPGYMNRAVLPQDLSAVTAACLLTPKALFNELGGLNEQQLTVAFNDVDYCLRVREAGYRVLYTPYAELYHHESVSRGKEDSPEKQARAQQEVAYMRARWSDIMQQDPFYNPNLNFAKPDFTLSKVPRVNWPW